MKGTAVPASGASRGGFVRWRSNQNFLVCLLSINLVIALSLSFVAGRKSVTTPPEFAQAQAELHLAIL